MEILEQLMKQADQAEVVKISQETTKIAYEGNKLKTSQVKETSGVTARVLKDGRLGFSSTSDASATDKLITNVLESAKFGEVLPLNFPSPAPSPSVTTYDRAIEEFSISHMVEIGQEIIELLIDSEPTATVDVSLERGIESFSLQNNSGAEISFTRSPLTITIIAKRVRGDDFLYQYSVQGMTRLEEDYLFAAEGLAKNFERAKQSASVSSGRMPVLFAPRGALTMCVPLLQALDGKNVYTGISPMSEKLGQKIFDEKLSVDDDPLLDGRYGSAPFDSEGVVHRRNPLIENGVVKTFYNDLKTAAQMGVEPTGNGSRGLFNPPSPSATNLVVRPGDTPLEEMLASIEEGLLVNDVLGLGQGNTLSGAFSNPLALAFKIEGGEIVGRVKDVSIAGNVYELLPEIGAVSQESSWEYTFVKMPYVLMPDINVVAKS
jgi:PmbA protein